MDFGLDLEDLAFPSTLRAVDDAGRPGPYLTVNQGFLDFYGMTEAPRAPVSFMGDSARGADEMDRRVAEMGEPVTYNLRFRGRLLTLQKSPVVRDGRVLAVLTVLTDQTDLGDSPLGPAHLGQVAESSLEAITLLEVDGADTRIVSQNRASLALDGQIDAGSAALANDARGALLQAAERAIGLAAPDLCELAIGDRLFRVRSEVIGASDSVPVLVNQAVADVSDRSRSEWLEELVALSSMPSIVAAAQSAFRMANKALGFDRGALLRFDGQMFDVFAMSEPVDVDRRLHAGPHFLELLSSPGVAELRHVPDFEEPLLDALGIHHGASVTLTVDDEPWGLLVIGQDRASDGALGTPMVTMLEALGATLNVLIERDRARQRLQESNRRLEEYAHAAAHDLRSPLRRIRSFSQILQARLGVDEIDRDQLSDFADRIARGAARLDALLESMLMHANISALAEESTEYTDLQELAESICEGIRELSNEPKPTFVVQDLPEVRLPHDAAERVLRNLIDNALKYSPTDSPAVVEITGEAFDGGVRVRVCDNGIGIEPQFADKVFQLFNQLSNDTSGSGVGLAVVERLLSTRGAKIWVESEVGRGATFVIEFPSDVLRRNDTGI